MKIHFLIVLVCIFMCIGCQSEEHHATWSVYKGDAKSSSYSALEQIDKDNVDQLRLAWTFRPNDASEGTRSGRSECNPIIIDSVMYASSARHRIYAVNAATGEKIWSFDPFDGGRGGGINRGVTYWEEGSDKRILFTAGDQLFALNAQTGKPISEFGQEGKVSMNAGMRDDPKTISIVPTSPGIIYQDLLIMGNEVSELYGAQPGYIRAYNVKTGKLVWTFHTIPKPGEPGYETWPKDAWRYAGGANDWGGMSLDKKRGMVFLALGSPTYDFYGKDRKGKNLYGNCIVALDAKTGKHIWHFQTIHHDLWDYDLPAPPNLVTVKRDGKKIDAVAQTSKVGFVYVLNRETGESLFPIEERKVPASDVPGEEAWPTQPFPLKPDPYSRQILTGDDIANFSPATHDSLLEEFRSFRYEGLFTPPSVRGTFNLPGTIGGVEWGGAAYDPATGVLYVKANNSPEIATMKKVEPEKETGKKSVYKQGKSFYGQYCASCHGEDRNGQEPDYPSLIGLKHRMSPKEVLDQIKRGGGKMPAFSSVLKGHEKEIMAYLFDIQDRDLSREVANEEVAKYDTTMRYLNVEAYHPYRDANGNPAIKPPWGTLNAINLSTGEYEWKIPVGNRPELQEEGAPPTGTTGSPGPVVTAGGLVFIGGTRDKKFRAYDKTNGKMLWETTLPAVGSSIPCTYMYNGKQYIAVSVSGTKENPGGYIMAFALPE